MARKKTKSAAILRTTLVSEPQQVQWHTERTYKLIIKGCFKKECAITSIRKPREYQISSDELHDGLRRLFQRPERPACLLVDFSSVPATAGGYAHRCDDLCRELHHRIDQIGSGIDGLLDIMIVVSDIKEFCGSVRLEERLIPSCRKSDIGLIIIALLPELRVRIMYDSGRLNSNINVNLMNITQEASTQSTLHCWV